MTSRLITALVVLLLWGLVWVSLTGLGRLARGSLPAADRTGSEEPFLSFWTGLAVLVLVLQFAHFVVAIRWYVGAPLLAVGFAGYGWKDAGAWRRPFTSGGRGTTVLLILLGVWAAIWAAGPPLSYDGGMYEIPAISWITSSPIVPGLANLHGRLGFNNATHLFAAIFEPGAAASWSHHVVSGLFVVILLVRAGRSVIEFRSGARDAATAFFDVMLVAPALYFLHSHLYISSHVADVPAAIAIFFSARWLLRIGREPALLRRPEWALGLGASVALAPAFKLSAAAFALGAVVAWLALDARTARVAGRLRARTALMVGAVWGGWSARSIVLSGHPAYPSSALPLPVDWRVPAAQVQAEADWTQFFSRWLGDIPSGVAHGGWDAGWSWLSPWISEVFVRDSRWTLVYPILLVVALAIASILLGARRDGAEGPARRWGAAPLAGTVAFALGFWFLTVPNPDFGIPLTWIAVAIMAGLAAQRAAAIFPPRALVAVGLALTLIPITVPVVANAARGQRFLDYRWGDATVPVPATEEWQTESGLTLRVPQVDNRCWATPLCTPHPAPNLELRDPSNVSRGFRAQGEWQATRWPNPWTTFPRRPERASEPGRRPPLAPSTDGR